MYKNILLDLDGTLLDFEAGQKLAFSELLIHYKMEPTDELCEKYAKINEDFWKRFERAEISKDKLQNERFKVFFESIGQNIDGIKANEIYHSLLKNEAQLMPYAKDVLEEISINHNLTIITNGIGNTQRHRLKISGISEYFTNIIISEEIKTAKPDLKFFEKVFEKIGSEKSQMLVVGDSLTSDIKGANNAGIDACWFNPKGIGLTEGLKINYEIKDLRELTKILQTYNPKGAD